MSDVHRQVQAILGRHLSPINARAFLDKAMRVVRTTHLEAHHLPSVVPLLVPSLRLFLGGDTAERVSHELTALAGAPPDDSVRRVEVAGEDDLAAVREMARRLCGQGGASSFATLRVLTVVSELARNIASYSHGGHIEMSRLERAIVVRAIDRGPGIAELPQILAGRYRSRTGLGLGILGVKRTAQEFDIQSSPSGTQVMAKVAL